jgi:hypothetical protein
MLFGFLSVSLAITNIIKIFANGCSRSHPSKFHHSLLASISCAKFPADGICPSLKFCYQLVAINMVVVQAAGVI